MMKDFSQLRELMEMALYDMMTVEHVKHVEAAEKAYKKGLGEQAEGLFLVSYMLYDHKMANGKSFFDNYKNRMSGSLLDSITRIRFGLYEVVQYPSGLSLKDPVCKEDFKMDDMPELDPGTLIIGRIIGTKDGNFLDDDFVEYPNSYLDAFRKSLLEKYNEFISNGTPLMVDKFITDFPLVLMTFADVVTDIEHETFEDVDNYIVYQSVYLTPNSKDVMEIIRTEKDFEVTLDESSYLVANFYNDIEDDVTELIGEVVVDGKRIEIDCTSEEQRQMVKVKIEKLFGDQVTHFKDDILTLEDLMV